MTLLDEADFAWLAADFSAGSIPNANGTGSATVTNGTLLATDDTYTDYVGTTRTATATSLWLPGTGGSRIALPALGLDLSLTGQATIVVAATIWPETVDRFSRIFTYQEAAVGNAEGIYVFLREAQSGGAGDLSDGTDSLARTSNVSWTSGIPQVWVLVIDAGTVTLWTRDSSKSASFSTGIAPTSPVINIGAGQFNGVNTAMAFYAAAVYLDRALTDVERETLATELIGPPPPPPPDTGARLWTGFEECTPVDFGDAVDTKTQLDEAFTVPPNIFVTQQNLNHAAIVDDGDGNQVLRVRYDPTETGTWGTPYVGYNVRFPNESPELWCQYRLKFEAGWEWGADPDPRYRAGKLPGLGGGEGAGGGGVGKSGFSARFMWENGNIFVYAYVYVEDRATWTEGMSSGAYGDAYFLSDHPTDETGTVGTKYTLPIDEWVTIRERVVMNSDGDTFDGVCQAWIDDVLLLDMRAENGNGVRWIGPDSTAYTADQFVFNTFYGGSSDRYAPSTTTYAQFDDFRVATTEAGLGPNEDPGYVPTPTKRANPGKHIGRRSGPFDRTGWNK